MAKSFRETIGLSPSSVDTSSGTTALLVIDTQNTYATGSPLAITNVEQTQKVIKEVVEKFRKANAPVIWIQHNAGEGAPIFDVKGKSGDFMPEIKPEKDEKIIVKGAPSSFTRTDLQEHLQSLGTKQVVEVGYMSHVCVTGTARSAMELGYDVIIVKDAIGDRDVPSHDGKSTVKAEQLVDMVCHELGDAIGTIIESKDIK